MSSYSMKILKIGTVWASLLLVVLLAIKFLAQDRQTTTSDAHRDRQAEVVDKHKPMSSHSAIAAGRQPVNAAKQDRQEPAKPVKMDATLPIEVGSTVEGDVFDSLRYSLGAEAFSRSIEQMSSPPESVLLRYEPAAKSNAVYNTFVRACDGKGNIIESGPAAITSSLGLLTQDVVSVDSGTGTYTIRESLNGDVVRAGSGSRTVMEKLPPIFTKTLTYARNGQLLKVEANGEDVTEDYKDVPRLVFPDKPQRPGDTWQCGGNRSTWTIKAKMDGFARVLGRDCAVVSFVEEQKVSDGEGINQVLRVGRRYHDLKTMIMVREEQVETIKGDLGAEGSEKSAFGVREMSVP